MERNDIVSSAKEFYPAIALDRLISRRARKRLRRFLMFVSFAMFAFVAIISVSSFLPFSVLASAAIASRTDVVAGWLLISLALWIVMSALEAYYRYHYFRGMDMAYSEPAMPRSGIMTMEAAEIVRGSSEDCLSGFFSSSFGALVAYRLGLKLSDVASHLASGRERLPFPALDIAERPVTASSIAAAIYKADPSLSKFLLSVGVPEKDFLGAARWIDRQIRKSKAEERTWGRDALSRIRPIGREWAFGGAYRLRSYSVDVSELPGFFYADRTVSYGAKEIDDLERIMMRAKGANAVLAGDDEDGVINIIERLGKKIMSGACPPDLADKEIKVLDMGSVIASAGDRNSFEREVIAVMNDLVKAGNIILVIRDFPNALSAAGSLGSDLAALLDPYLASPAVNLIVLSDTARFHEAIESHPTLSERFEKVLMKTADPDAALEVIEGNVPLLESKYDTVFTYQALRAVAESADRYFPDGVMPDKAIDLLVEAAAAAAESNDPSIGREDVEALVAKKTGIPVGTVTAEEKDKLINLEDVLHQRVIGQDEAIRAISSAMRRARTGLSSPGRPIGSFLFLGPTGVGKTETSKALSEIFFGPEAPMIRLDMSEYTGPDALNKLIGSHGSGAIGILSAKLREQPYGVLLLDEFEKTSRQVMDLFLQILDEGVFSDMAGRKVSARNTIIIATSNAAAEIIWDIVKKKNESLEANKEMLIDDMISRGIFRPELLNRFDGVILFHPLAENHLRSIARLMLKKLQNRMREKGVDLVINDTLVDFLVRQGMDPKFGARPLNRAIQERVEEVIARKMIKGEISSGTSFEFSEKDLS